MARHTETGEIATERAAIADTSLEVSRVALGTWATGGWMWGGTDETESIATIRAAVDHGINLIDTAPVYGFGRSEAISRLGKWSGSGALLRWMCCSRPTICSSATSRPTSSPIAKRTRSRPSATAPSAAGLLSGRMRPDSKFDGDDLRRTGPKFQQPRFAQYLAAGARLYKLAQQRFRKHVIHLAIRWMLDQGITTALWGARLQPQ